MQLHLLPSFVCNRLDRISRSFLWGGDGLSRTWNHVNWEFVTSPKRYEGLGIRDARIANISLHGKLIWSMFHDKDKLSVQLLTHKYLGKNSLWVGKNNCRPFITWKNSLMGMFSVLEWVTLLSGLMIELSWAPCADLFLMFTSLIPKPTSMMFS